MYFVFKLTSTVSIFSESRRDSNVGTSSGQPTMLPLEDMVVIRMPMVARMRGERSPTHLRHSCFMNFFTSGGNESKWFFTLFFRINPDKDLVGSSKHENIN